MLRSSLVLSALGAAILFLAAPAAAQDACLASYDAYGLDATGSVTCSCDVAQPNGTIYGTGNYTSDSDLCTAARHAGQIAGGGVVKLRGAAGCNSYPGSTQNGITSDSWQAWDLSFYFPGAHDGSCATGGTTNATPMPAPMPMPMPMPMPQPAGDALSMVLALAQTLPPGSLTYQDAKSLGPTAFELTGVVLAPEGPASAIPINRLLVENIDMMGLMGGAPSVMKLRIDGMTLTPNNSDIDSDFWEMLGTNTLLTNLVLDFTTDAATQAFKLNDFTLDFPGVAKATLALDLLGVGPQALMAPEMAMFTASLKSATLTVEDLGFLARGLATGVRESGMTEQQLLDIGLQELSNSLAEMGAAPGDRVFAVGELLGGLMLDAKSPKGPLTVSLSPAQPLTFESLNQVASAAEAADLANLQASYGGTRATLPPAVVSDDDYPSEAFVFTDKDLYTAGETVIVFWSGLPGNQQDLVAVVPSGAPLENLGNWTYTQGATDGVFEAAGLAPGAYEVRVFFDHPNGGTVVQAQYFFTVQ